MIVFYGVGRGTHVTAHVWRSDNNSVQSVLSYCLYVGSGNQNQVVRFAQHVPLSSEASCQSVAHFSNAEFLVCN